MTSKATEDEAKWPNPLITLCDANSTSFDEMPAFCAIIQPAYLQTLTNFVAFAAVNSSLMYEGSALRGFARHTEDPKNDMSGYS